MAEKGDKPTGKDKNKKNKIDVAVKESIQPAPPPIGIRGVRAVPETDDNRPRKPWGNDTV